MTAENNPARPTCLKTGAEIDSEMARIDGPHRRPASTGSTAPMSSPFRRVAEYEHGLLIGAASWPAWAPAALTD